MERFQYASGSNNRRVNEILLRVGWLPLATGLTNSTSSDIPPVSNGKYSLMLKWNGLAVCNTTSIPGVFTTSSKAPS